MRSAQRQIEHTSFPEVGHCIYCSSTERLTKEHIIAKAVGGTVTLRKSSCDNCGSITRDLEQFCFRDVMGAFRIHAGFRRHDPTCELVDLSMRYPSGYVEKRRVRIEQHPAFFVLPRYHQPQIFTGSSDASVGCWTYQPKQIDFKSFPEGARIGGSMFHAGLWARMLAKIAHAFAVADIGQDAFVPHLPSIILKGEPAPTLYVGCIEPGLEPPMEEVLHRVHLERTVGMQKTWVVANIRLFANLGAPQYHVVVGELLRPELLGPPNPPNSITISIERRAKGRVR